MHSARRTVARVFAFAGVAYHPSSVARERCWEVPADAGTAEPFHAGCTVLLQFCMLGKRGGETPSGHLQFDDTPAACMSAVSRERIAGKLSNARRAWVVPQPLVIADEREDSLTRASVTPIGSAEKFRRILVPGCNWNVPKGC